MVDDRCDERRDDVNEQPTVVVGVDGSEESRAALRYAMEDAARRGARVLVVRAFEHLQDWPGPDVRPWPPSNAEMVARLEAGARVMLDSIVADPGTRAARAPVDIVAVQGPPAKVLVHQARGADLLVLGHGGHGGIAAGMLLGSVALACVLHAPCPITIVRPERDAARESTEPAPAPVPA